MRRIISKNFIYFIIAIFLVIVIVGLIFVFNTSSTPKPGSDRDEHGCIGSAGYVWCDALQKCLRSWEEDCPSDSSRPGSDRDEHGCIGSAGYVWCEASQKCLRPWEESCPSDVQCTKEGTDHSLSLSDAKVIAEDSTCVHEGDLDEKAICNEVTGTWWIDLDIEKEGCSPACVIDVETMQADINWRCTGLLSE